MSGAKKTAVDIVLGTAFIGTGTTGGMACLADKEVIQSILDEFKKHGHVELDSARIYGDGTSESLLAESNYADQGFLIDTKVASFVPGIHTAEKIAASVHASLTALKTKKVHILYLHAPDRATPFEVTLAAINEEYKQGHFEKFGLSNYTAEEVEQIVKITKEKGYVQPTVYQGLYNLIARNNEEKLFPVLRKYGLSFFAYSPLAAGFLTENVAREQESAPGSRFDNSYLGKLYRDKFFKDALFQGVDQLKEVGQKHGLTVQEIALRWIVHHSQLKRQYNDAIITGGRTPASVAKSLDYLEQPALPAEVVQVVEEVWKLVKGDAPSYHY